DEVTRSLPEHVAEALEALTRGINRWLEEAVATRRLPVEMDWLGYTPAPWTPAASAALWHARCWALTRRPDTMAPGEARRRHVPADLLTAFMATELRDEVIAPDGTAGAPARAPGRSVPGGADTGEGSNNWAVAAGRTPTGYPVLCSDPHNPFEQPGQW